MNLWRNITTRLVDNVTSLRERFARVTQPYLVENAAVLRMASDRDPNRTNEEMTSKSDVHDQGSEPNLNRFSAYSAKTWKTTFRNYSVSSSVAREAHYNYSYPTPILLSDIVERYVCYNMISEKQYNFGLLGFGVTHCLSYIAYFCRYEGRERGLEVVSMGSDDGLVDTEVIDHYRFHFDKELDITSVNAQPNPKREIQFKAVDELIWTRPKVVGNCILLLIWPEFAMEKDLIENELDVIRKLQPRKVLTVYESRRGLCGGNDFQAYMRGDKNYAGWDRYENKSPGLENYSIVEIAKQAANLEAGQKVDSIPDPVPPGFTFMEFKMTLLSRNDCAEQDPVTPTPRAKVCADASEV